jgi:DNA-binding CsgD family transcriptional regulator
MRLDAADLVHVMELVWMDMVVHPLEYLEKDSLHRQELPGGARLSSQELALLRMLAQGSTDNEIAKALNIGRRTVHSYLERIRGKLGANNRVHAVALAASAGLVYARGRDRADGVAQG